MATKLKAKTKTAPTKKAAPAATKKSSKNLSPLEKARLARAKGGAKAKPARKRNALPTFEAPADFKPHFLEVAVRTDKDGLLGSTIKGTRYQGRYDPEAEDKKKFDLGSYDVPTLIGIQARLAAVTFRTNPTKVWNADIAERNATMKVKTATGETRDKLKASGAHRLPANTAFRLLFRIGRKSADNTLTVALKHVEQGVKIKGVMKAKQLDKKDPIYRAFGRARRILPAAFKNVQMPPKRTRGANKKVDAEE
jgi:hypothetical protein